MHLFLFLIPVLMLVFGLSFLKIPPKKINWVYGYRTTKSMKNQDTWDYAHHFAGVIWFYSGLIMSVIILIFIIIDKNLLIDYFMIFMIVELILLILNIPLTEIKLSKTFDKDGKYK